MLRVIATDKANATMPDLGLIDGPLHAALDGQPFLTASIGGDDRIDPINQAAMARVGGFAAGMLVPIRTGGMIAGVLCLVSRRPSQFDLDDLARVESFAVEAATAIELNQARRYQAQIRVLEDRERLAEDLHDLVIQRLFAAGMHLQAVQSLAGDPRVSERIDETVTQLDQSIAELRSAIFRLHNPTQVAQQIDAVIERAATQLGFEPTVALHGNPETIRTPTIDQLLPTLTEALSNTARHAKATAVAVTLTTTPDGIELVVADNGTGIDPTRPRGNGLDNIESRANRLGGTATLTTHASGGTTLIWTARTTR